MKISGVDCNVLYVDSTATGGTGDGSTMANALLDFPTIATMQDNTVYLLRRHDTNDIFWAEVSSFTSITNIFFIGMPLTTDSLYGSLPVEAQGTSWDSDPETHARIFWDNGADRLKFSGVYNFGVHRIKIVRNDDTSQTNGSNAMLTFIGPTTDDGQTSGNGFITNCEAMTDSRDFSDNGFVDPETSTGATFTSYFQYYNKLTIKNNKFVQYYRTSNDANYIMFEMDTIIFLDFENNVIYRASSSSTTSGNDILYGGKKMYLCKLLNNQVFYYGQNSSNQSFIGGFRIFSDGIIAKNNKISFYKKLGSHSGTNSGQYGMSYLFYYDPERSERYNSGSGTAYKANPIRIIENLEIDMRDSLLHAQQRCLVVHDYQSGSLADHPIEHARNDPETSLKNIKFYMDKRELRTAGNNSSETVRLYNPGLITEDITIEAEDQSNYAAYLAGFKYVKDINIKGRAIFRACSYVDLDSLEYTQAETANIIYNEHSFLNIKNVTLTNVTTSSWLGLENNNQTTTFRTVIENVNKPLLYNWNNDEPQLQYAGLWVNNIGGEAGRYFATNQYYSCATWGIRRNNGATGSLRFTSATDSNIPLTLNPSSYINSWGTTANMLNGVIRVHCAFKLMADPSLYARRVIFSVDYPKTGTYADYSENKNSLTEGYWEDDTDTWTEDNLIRKVCVIPFSKENPTDFVALRVQYFWYDPTGYFYLDPVFEVTAS